LDSSKDFKFREFSNVSDTSDKKSDTLGPKPPCLAFDPQNPDRAYWGTFDNGFCKTDDRGQSWYNIGKDAFSSPLITYVAVSSLNGGNRFNKVYAGTEPSAVYISDDGGDTWNVISNGLSKPDGTTMPILASNRKVPGEFYAANNHGIFISTDSGESWRKLRTEWPNEYTPLALAVSE
jgi:photosystem II stability/assembly factor-like uncharacterized protein